MPSDDLPPLNDDAHRALMAAAQHALAYRISLSNTPVTPDLRPSDMASQFGSVLPEQGKSALSVI